MRFPMPFFFFRCSLLPALGVLFILILQVDGVMIDFRCRVQDAALLQCLTPARLRSPLLMRVILFCRAISQHA